MNNACCVWDFTLFDDISSMDIRLTLKEICKKYCFQSEIGHVTGKKHFQGRMSLMLKKRQIELIDILKKNWIQFHISITSNENKNNNFYVMKEDTRIEGPFTDENDIYIPRDIRDIKNLYMWQTNLRNILKVYDERAIDIIYDKHGNIGKTTLIRYMMLFDDAELLPMCNDYRDIMRMACDIGPKKIYLIDMPRAMNKTNLFSFYSGIETLKSGYCYDERYKFKKLVFDRPRICVFTNTKPDLSMLSKDMWNMWKVKNNILVPFYKTDRYDEDVQVSYFLKNEEDWNTLMQNIDQHFDNDENNDEN